MGANVTCDPRAPPNTPYYFVEDRSISVALGVSAFIGVISAISATGLLIHMLMLWFKPRRILCFELEWRSPRLRELRPLTLAFVLWIVMDLIQGLSYAFSFQWAVLGKVNSGAFCTAQGVLEQFGDAGTAMSAFVVVILVVVRYFNHELIDDNWKRISYFWAAFLTVFLILLIIPPATTISHYYGNTGLWCWIDNNSPTNARLQIAACYALMWLAALTSVFGYGYLCFIVYFRQDPDAPLGRREAVSLIFYSLAYCIEVLPISIIRLKQFKAAGPCPHVRPGWDIFAICLLGASGFINALLWIITGRRFGFERRNPE